MNSFKSIWSVIIIACASGFATSCQDEDPEPVAVVTTKISDLAADPGTGFNSTTGQPTGVTNKFTFFSFKTGAVVASADSASAKWDLGFRASTIIVNSATSGPGTSQVQIVSGIFDDITTAPESGYKSDNDPSPIAGAPNANLAIPTGSAQGWYTYDPATNTNKPTAGKVIIIKTSEGRYAKVEILSYYKGAPSTPASSDIARYYTFRYVYQPNDSKSFIN